MSLTDHLRRYLEGADPDLALLVGLADLIRERLQRSFMWGHPPDFFGYPEYHSWSEAFSDDDPSPGPAGDFFLEEIVPEQDFLRKTVQAGNPVEALLRQKVRWFLTDRQRKHDPIGYRVFENLVATVQAMLDDGAIAAANLVRGKVRNPTVVRLTAAEPGPPADTDELARVIDHDPEWSAVLLRLAKLGRGAQRLLRERLDRFPTVGVRAFQVGELGGLLKSRARAANRSWNRPAGEDSASAGRDDGDLSRTSELGDRYFTSEEVLVSFGRRVREAIERSDFTDKVRRRMLVVLDDWLKYLAAGQDTPKVREWAIQLGLPKSSLNEYRNNLLPFMRAVLEGGTSG
jgi:hypothetical protein